MRIQGGVDIILLPSDASLRDADCRAFQQTADFLAVFSVIYADIMSSMQINILDYNTLIYVSADII